MPSPRNEARLRARRRQELAARRARRFAGLALLGVVLVVSLLLTAFGRGSDAPAAPGVAVTSLLPDSTRPTPQIVAQQGRGVRIQLPIAWKHVTAIGYHAAGDGALVLTPVGRRANEGLLQRLAHKLVGGGGHGPVWYQLDGGTGPATSALDVGAAPDTDVYAPVDGTVVGITPYIVDQTQYGVRIDIQPQSSPAVVVTLTHLRADPSLTVGSPVQAGRSKIGNVVDLSSVEHQALARYTNDAGNHVVVEVRPSAALSFAS